MKPFYADDLVTLYQGDSLEILPNIDNKNIDILITDPPYGVLPNGKGDDKFEWDNVNLKVFSTEWFSLIKDVLKNDSLKFIFWSQKFLNLGVEIFKPNRLLMWRYDNLINGGNGDFAYDYDPIFYIRSGSKKIKEGKHSCDLHYTKPQSNFKSDCLLHPTQKPLKLMLKLIDISAKDDDVILDPFSGSGTTLLASKIKGIRCIGIEKSIDYCNIIVDRIKSINQKKLF